MMDTLVRISTTQRRFAPTVSAIVGITVRNHRNTHYPSIQNADRLLPQEPYFFELVYRPFFTAFQWFGYGCLFGWWRYRRKVRKGSG